MKRLVVLCQHLQPCSSGSKNANGSVVILNGESLTPESLVSLQDPSRTVQAWNKVKEGRAVVDKIIADGKVTYGINTGFGAFANVVIPEDQLSQLQHNLIRSHSVGVGEYLSLAQTRMLMALRINVLAKGHSGVHASTLQALIRLLNLNALPAVPCQGTVGASGDLAPLSHIALGLLGEGSMWDPVEQKYRDAAQVLERFELEPLKLQAKEGLALINGTQFISALGCEAIVRAKNVSRCADVAAAFTVEVLKGTHTAFAPEIHRARPHKGQMKTAARLTSLLKGWSSEVSASHLNCGKVQDAYTLRCVPQVHGVVKETIKFCSDLLSTEINSATDNPMVFADTGRIMSAGNFHGEYPAKALDYLAIGVHELSSMSERRIDRLMSTKLNEYLPAFLVQNGGVNSGLMMAHVTASALVSENKTLVHPASADSITTSAGQEDHVSMGGWAARKALQVVANVERVIAIELLAACQALEFLRPLRTTKPLEYVYETVRELVPPIGEQDRYLKPDIDSVTQLVRSGKIWKAADLALQEPM